MTFYTVITKKRTLLVEQFFLANGTLFAERTEYYLLPFHANPYSCAQVLYVAVTAVPYVV